MQVLILAGLLAAIGLIAGALMLASLVSTGDLPPGTAETMKLVTLVGSLLGVLLGAAAVVGAALALFASSRP